MKQMLFKIAQGALLSLFFSTSFAQQAETNAVSDTITARFITQLQSFPQEKIHVQTDKSYYLAGETVWFRIYLVDALSHRPDTTSRYVYAELINPADSVVRRVKTRPIDGSYHGEILLEEDLPEGDYLLRFYTRFMESVGEDYFFRKKITVGDPLSASYRTEAAFSYDENGKQVNAGLHFIDLKNRSLIWPESIQINDGKGNLKTVKPDADTVARVKVNLPKEKKKNVLYIEYDYLGKPHKEYIPVPDREDDFDVSFFPEGGQVPLGALSRISFKALNSNGLGEDITGIVVSEEGDTLRRFQSQYLGMGFFMQYAEAGKKYYAICKNRKDREKKFELPAATEDAISLHVTQKKDRFHISLIHSPDFLLPDSLFLVAHCRGFVFYSAAWDRRREFIPVSKALFPSGVIHLLLVDTQFRPISERLVFNLNENELPRVSVAADKPAYGKREAVTLQLNVTGADGQPLNGDCSISVTDASDLLPDTCAGILSTLLLTSELNGHIESSANYFREENALASSRLDLLMMTQGWRRYDVPAVLRGEIAQPETALELSPRITGTLKGGLMMNRPSADYPVTVLSVNPEILGQTTTNAQGRFTFNVPEFPDSTRFLVQGKTKKGGERVELLLDPETFPPVSNSLPFSYMENRRRFEKYLEKAEQQYLLENGMRMIYLQDVEITAKRRVKKGKSPYSSPFNTRVTSEEIEKRHFHDLYSLLMTIPGIVITGDRISIQGGGTPLFLVDGFEMEIELLKNFVIEDVDEVEIVKGAQGAIFGGRGSNGAIMLTTKRGFDQTLRSSQKFNLKATVPLGYQTPRAFYSPVYETPEDQRREPADLRTTIYWNPRVEITDGNAEISFYTADVPGTYSVVIEGISTEGALIQAKETISREK